MRHCPKARGNEIPVRSSIVLYAYSKYIQRTYSKVAWDVSEHSLGTSMLVISQVRAAAVRLLQSNIRSFSSSITVLQSEIKTKHS